MFTSWQAHNRKSCAPVLTPEDEIEYRGNGGGKRETAAMALRFCGARIGDIAAKGRGV
jgi:hypothetical protein